MKKNGYLFCVATLLFSVSVFSGAALAGSKTPPAPTLQSLKGDVSVRSGSSDKWESVKEPGFKLKNGSTIRTAQGSAEIFCPDGSTLKFEPNTTSILSVAGDGRVQINTTQGFVNAALGKSSIETQIGQGQILQEKYNPKTAETDISCVNGSSTLTMPNGAKVALTKGDVITSSPKDRSVKVQSGTVKVTQGTNTRLQDAGFQVFFPRKKPFYVGKFPVVRGRYGYMNNPFVTKEEYAYTDEYLAQHEASFAEESAAGKEGVASQEAWEEDAAGDASLQKEDLENTGSTEEQSLQQDDGGSPMEQGAQETEAFGGGGDSVGGDSVGNDGVGNDSVGGDSAGNDSVGGDSVGNDSVGGDSVGGDNAGNDSVGGDSVGGDSGGGDSGGGDSVGGDSGGGDSGGGDSVGGDSGGGDSGGGDSGGGE